jgi:P-type Cu+ transporter
MNVVRHSTHPVSRKIAEHFSSEAAPVPFMEHCVFTEIPGKGIQADSEDSHVRIGSSTWVRNTLDNEGRVYVEINGNVRGYFLLKNCLRPGLLQSLLKLSGHYPLIILSGDSPHEQKWLAELLPDKTEMHFNMSPYDKLNFIQAIRTSGKKVLMIGDGLNDAGALKESDVGVAVTEDISQFSPASDGILEGNQLIKLPQFLSFSKNSQRIIIISFILSFFYNVAGITLAVTGFLTPVIAAIFMPLSSVTIVGFTILAGNFLAERKQL